MLMSGLGIRVRVRDGWYVVVAYSSIFRIQGLGLPDSSLGLRNL